MTFVDTVLEQQRKQIQRVCKEICFHIFGVILLIGLVITILILDFRKEKRIEKIVVSVLSLIYFIIPASIILRQKVIAVKQLNTQKLRRWIMWETINMGILTIFFGFGTKSMLLPPFDFITGTILLMIIYWLPLFAYKVAQLFRIKKFIRQIELTVIPNSSASV